MPSSDHGHDVQMSISAPEVPVGKIAILNPDSKEIRMSDDNDEHSNASRGKTPGDLSPLDRHSSDTLDHVTSSSMSSPPTINRMESELLDSPAKSKALKLDKEIARLNEVLSEVSGEAAQKVLRERWRVFLFKDKDSDHLSFILRAGLLHAEPIVLERVARDSRILTGPFLDAVCAKPTVIEQVLSRATTQQLMTHVPEEVRDWMFADRMKTIGAKELIRSLAQAQRLGYEPDDILEDEESVVPNITSSQDSSEAEVLEVEPRRHSTPKSSNHVSPDLKEHARRAVQAALERHQQYVHPQQVDVSQLSCPTCGARFPTQSGYNYHITKKPCSNPLKQAPMGGYQFFCQNCIQGFTTKQGKMYHEGNKVCQNYDIAPPTPAPISSIRSHNHANETVREPQSRIAQVAPRVTPDTILPPRPPFSQPAPPPPAATLPPPSLSQTPATIPRPPLHTPSVTPNGPRNQAPSPEFRQSPSELPPEKYAALQRELDQADEHYRQQVSSLLQSLSGEERSRKLTSFKNAAASRKSQIRRAYNVSLRLREKDKAARRAAGIVPAQRPRLESAPASTPPPTRLPPVSTGFLPVNAPQNEPREVGNTSNNYKPPPANVAQRVYNPLSDNHPNTLSHALESASSSPAGSFAVLRPGVAQHTVPTNFHPQPNPQKRLRSSTETDQPPPKRSVSAFVSSNLFDHSDESIRPYDSYGAQTYSTRVSSTDVQTQNEASRYSRISPVSTITSVTASSPKVSDTTNTSTTNSTASPKQAPAQAVASASGGATPIPNPIQTSSSGTGDNIAKGAINDDKENKSPTIERVESDKTVVGPGAEKSHGIQKIITIDSSSESEMAGRSESRGPKRGGFMAKRGGKH